MPDGARRARQLTTIGRELSQDGMMSEQIQELALDAIAVWAAGYSANLGDGVKRRLRITDADETHLDLDVMLTGLREPQHRYRLTLTVQEEN